MTERRSSVSSHTPPTITRRDSQWVPDSAYNSCYSCGQSFNLFSRRHHCRICGQLFCNKCSSKRVPIPNGGEVRACDECYQNYRKTLLEVTTPKTKQDIYVPGSIFELESNEVALALAVGSDPCQRVKSILRPSKNCMCFASVFSQSLASSPASSSPASSSPASSSPASSSPASSSPASSSPASSSPASSSPASSSASELASPAANSDSVHRDDGLGLHSACKTLHSAEFSFSSSRICRIDFLYRSNGCVVLTARMTTDDGVYVGHALVFIQRMEVDDHWLHVIEDLRITCKQATTQQSLLLHGSMAWKLTREEKGDEILLGIAQRAQFRSELELRIQKIDSSLSQLQNDEEILRTQLDQLTTQIAEAKQIERAFQDQPQAISRNGSSSASIYSPISIPRPSLPRSSSLSLAYSVPFNNIGSVPGETPEGLESEEDSIKIQLIQFDKLDDVLVHLAELRSARTEIWRSLERVLEDRNSLQLHIRQMRNISSCFDTLNFARTKSPHPAIMDSAPLTTICTICDGTLHI